MCNFKLNCAPGAPQAIPQLSRAQLESDWTTEFQRESDEFHVLCTKTSNMKPV